MSETQEERTARQELIFRKAVSQLSSIADDLENLTREVFEKSIEFESDVGADVMALSFVTKQREHLRSVRKLIDIKAHRDALLIARTMLEGLGRLLWAFRKRPERTNLWLWYGAILDWRQMMKNEDDGIAVDQQEKAELKLHVEDHGADYFRSKVVDAIQTAEKGGLEYRLPEDPWRNDWTVANVESMFVEVRGQRWYDNIYRYSSEWVHWGPRAILRAQDYAEWGVSGFTEDDWQAAAMALQTGCQSLLQSLEVLNLHFSLGIDIRLDQLDQAIDIAWAESVAAGIEQ